MFNTHYVHNLSHQKSIRRTLRNNLTPAEATLWRALQRSQLAGRKFRRQHGIGPYTVDFYCAAEKLVIELDGSEHYTASGEANDAERTAYLNKLGFRVLRFENRFVLEQIDNVLAAVEAAFMSGGETVQRLSTTPNPSSSEEGN